MNIKNMKNEKGFTIVELLIVIVVIGILAAITIVAYNGVQARAKTTTAQDSASKVAQKAEAYNADKSAYPTTAASLTGALSTDSFQVVGITIKTSGAVTASDSANTVNLYTCGTAAGNQVFYWDFTNNKVTTTPLTAGVTTGTCTMVTS